MLLSAIYYVVNITFIKMGLWSITMFCSILTIQMSDNVAERESPIANPSVCLKNFELVEMNF